MKISKYVTQFKFAEHIALYHSLRMKPVYLTNSEATSLNKAIQENCFSNIDANLLHQLKTNLILIDNDKEDERILPFVQSHIPPPYISLAYFILTEQCNLACKYCFLGNSNPNKCQTTNYPMTKDTAEQALQFFSRQTLSDPSQFDNEKEIIFYGGEPLLNFETLAYVIKRAKHYQKLNLLSKKLKFSLVTNGILLDEEKIIFLKNNNINVSISIDGADASANCYRVNKVGEPIYEQLMSNINLSLKHHLSFGLSITLNNYTLEHMDDLIKMLTVLNIDAICFNILLKIHNEDIDDSYYQKATQFILDFYTRTKKIGIYEDRFMRKLNSFVTSNIYFSDCAATSGSQIVITPDGGVGLCHGCMENRDFFIGNIYDNTLFAEKHPTTIEWSRLTPVLNKNCESCPALGICGGGCPINAKTIGPSKSIYDVDSTFCIYATNTLKFLIKTLLDIILSKNHPIS